MRMKKLTSLFAAALIALSGQATAQTVTTNTSDGVIVYGDMYLAKLTDKAPLIHLFHQGGSNGRGEYAPLIGWLNESGFRVIVWDQRSGGDTYGESNRTAANIADQPDGYCNAYPDVEAALSYGESIAAGAPVIIWGSSYSAALVFQAAAKNPDHVKGVVAFSPASGGPLTECRARNFLTDVKIAAFVLRPESEMGRESSIEQREIFEAAGVQFTVVVNGVHGSSMLVDERTGHNMSAARDEVIAWLTTMTKKDM